MHTSRQPPIRRLALTLAIGAALGPGTLLAQQTPPAQSGQQNQNAEQDPQNPDELDTIEVVGVRGAIFTARSQERDNDVITNVVTSDDAGQFADQNVAESLQRVPGLSIDRDAGEGRRITVRGLGAQFNPVTINGVLLATSDLDRDAVVDVLPNDLLGTLSVTKTLTPDMNADAIGGAVDLRAIDPFERDDGGSLRVEAGRAEYADGIDPKFSGVVNGKTDTASGGRFGYSLSASYSQRDLWGDIQRNRDVPRYTAIGADCNQDAPAANCVLRSLRVDNRVDRSERTRYGLAANLNWQPNQNQEYFLRLIGSRYDRDDQTYTDRWQMGATRATALGPGTGSFQGGTDVELRKQVTFVEREETTMLAHLGGRTTTDLWSIDYSVAGSRNRLDIPEQLTGRFRIRNIGIDYAQTGDSVSISGRQRGSTFPNPNDPAAYAFDQLTLIQEDREDTILQGNVDARRDFDWNDRAGFMKFGVKVHRRDKQADRQESVRTPASGTTLASLSLQNLDTRIPNYGGLQPDGGDAYDLFRRTLAATSGGGFNSNSGNQDYLVKEDVDSAYVMGSLDLTRSFSLFGGVRIESTDWFTTGFEVETIDPTSGPDINIVRPIEASEVGYTDVLPSLHMRWEPNEKLVIRGSLSSAIVRPNFDEASATRVISTRQITTGFTRTYEGGNPLLDPLRAKQADLSIAWYPSETTFLYAGLFYKRIDDFYIQGQLIGADVAQIGLPVGNGTINGGFDVANVFLNGERATVRGVELVYEQAFVNLPGLLSGLFLSGNLTLVDSEADYGRAFNFRKAALPDQADRVANLSLGWENERFTARVSANYRDEQLDIINRKPELDQVVTDFFSVDLNLRWNINDSLQLYFDGANLNNEKDVTVWRGNASSGGSFVADEGGAVDFGRSYAVGMRYRF
jgi:iron complex outermembrane recepter protein